MILANDDASVVEIARRLRNGTQGREHDPPAVAALLVELVRQRRELRTHISELEQITQLTSTASHERNLYARGWRGALAAVIGLFPGDIELERSVAGLKPNFTQASAEALEETGG